ncbi:DUF4390 domain-containing protein [Candidatus Magnetomoraceae bacterium gMMP-13]
MLFWKNSLHKKNAGKQGNYRKYDFKPSLLTCIMIFFICLSLSLPVQAKEAKITDIIVTNTRDDLLLYMGVEGCFTEEMINAILSGVPTSFSFFISLYKVRRLWDSEIADIKITHTIKYDNLKKEFTVMRSWDKNSPFITNSFAEARKFMTKIDILKITALKKLKKGCQYQIRAKAELSKVTLPFYLHYVFFFVSLWDFETDWYTLDFMY